MARNASRSGGHQVNCDVNTTPLIDVMLVLLVMMIMSLPAQNHAIKLNLPRPAPTGTPPPSVSIDIDPDGTIVWNSETLSGIAALEAHFREESIKQPQAEIRLRPSATARYDVVANVMASAQRIGMTRMGFTNIAKFAQ